VKGCLVVEVLLVENFLKQGGFLVFEFPCDDVPLVRLYELSVVMENFIRATWVESFFCYFKALELEIKV